MLLSRRALSITLVACAPHSQSSPIISSDAATLTQCSAELTRLATPKIADSLLVGRYNLFLAAEEKSTVGEVARGKLELRIADSAYKSRMDTLYDPQADRNVVRNAFYAFVIGTASIDVRRVGAMVNGDMSSANPLAPGVFLLQSQPILILGRFPMALDGGSTSLRIIGGNSHGFWGTWSSWFALSRSSTNGRFCASRIPQPTI